MLQVIVHFKLPYTLSREFEQLRDEKKVKSIDEMFHPLSDIISRREITEVNTSRPTFCGTSQNDDEQDNNRQGGYANSYGYGAGSSRPTSNRCCNFCGSASHFTSRCREPEITMDKRKEIVRTKRLCQNCLGFGHIAHLCPRKGI